jgi:hypothetical protein
MKFSTRPTLLTLFAITAALTTILTTAAPAQAQSAAGSAEQSSKKNWQEDHTMPTWAIKTNLLYDATTTLNLVVEFRTSRRTSIDLPFNYNPWSFRGGETKIKHFLAQPEFRWWLKETFRGHFFGLHGHYAFYNVGGLPHGPFSQYMRDHRFQGHLGGAGVSWGYRWNFNHRWGLEVTLGVGYAYLTYDKFECRTCGTNLGHETEHYFGPTKAGVKVILALGSKKKPPVAPPLPDLIPMVAVPSVYIPALSTRFVVPEVEPIKARSETGQAYLHFAAGRSQIQPSMGNNAAELQKIRELIQTVAQDPDATINGVVITGWASPEGTYHNNMALSERRTSSIRDYISKLYNFPTGSVSSRSGGEDWATLETLVSESDIAGKEQLLTIIRSDESHDVRERQMAEVDGGRPFRHVRNDIYPKLRRTDYQLLYEVIPINIERGKQVLKTRPSNLSLNEMFLISETYEPGSAAYNEVFEIAARVFPDNDVANINAAAIALNRRDAATAERLLSRVKVHSAAWSNNMGVLAWLKGEYTTSLDYFRAADEPAHAAEMEKVVSSANIAEDAKAANAEAQMTNAAAAAEARARAKASTNR